MNITYDEIKEQYNSLRKTFDYLSTKKDEIIRFYKEKAPDSLTYIGSGSSYCLSQSAEMSAKLRLGLPATALAAGDLMLNFKEYRRILERTIIIAFSRSGSTSEVLKAIKNVQKGLNLPVLGIACAEKSEMSKLSGLCLELPWAFDESVCQTRSVVNLYTANLLVLGYLNGDHQLIDNINKVIDDGNKFMNFYEGKLRNIAEDKWHNAVVLADGEIGGIASEGALAFSEICRVPGCYYHLLDVRHGPMVLLDENTLAVICLTEEGFGYQKDLVMDLLKKGVTVVTYSDLPCEPIPGVKLHINSGKKLDRAVRGINFIVIPQMLSYYKAIKNGVNPDQPEGLAAWIEL